MSNKGFTLIEIILIVGVLAAMFTIFSVNVTRDLNKANETKDKQTYSELIAAADAYVHSNHELSRELYSGTRSSYTVYVSDLRKSGYISNSYSNGNGVIADGVNIVVTRNSTTKVLEFKVNGV